MAGVRTSPSESGRQIVTDCLSPPITRLSDENGDPCIFLAPLGNLNTRAAPHRVGCCVTLASELRTFEGVLAPLRRALDVMVATRPAPPVGGSWRVRTRSILVSSRRRRDATAMLKRRLRVRHLWVLECPWWRCAAGPSLGSAGVERTRARQVGGVLRSLALVQMHPGIPDRWRDLIDLLERTRACRRSALVTDHSSGRAAKSRLVFLYHAIPEKGFFHLPFISFNAPLCVSSPPATISFRWLSCAFMTSFAVFP